MEVSMQIEVFVSYSRKDNKIVEPIVEKLRNAGFAVWRDRENLPSNSTDFSKEAQKAIDFAQCVLVIWTENSIDSEYVSGEAIQAKNQRKLVQVNNGIAHNKLKSPFNVAQCTPLDLSKVVELVRQAIGVHGPLEHIVNPSVIGPAGNFENPGFRYLVPGKELFLSFYPCGESGYFLTMRFDTTSGWISTNDWDDEENIRYVESRAIKKNDETSTIKVTNQIYLIQDPIRPLTIQIGELRALRPNADPGYINGEVHKSQLEILPLNKPWMSMTLAEIISDSDALEELNNKIDDTNLDVDYKKKVKKLIAKNPNAPIELQKANCDFCDEVFKKQRHLTDEDEEKCYNAYMIANDFPFGPYFHYLSITSEAVHTWEDLTYFQLRGLNLITYQFLQNDDHLHNADGIGFGFNSTVRHLVLGDHSHSAAGASIPHIHKQVWGMSAGTSNLANQLIEVCQAYENHGIDYLGNYMNALQEAGYVMWRNDYVMLYVPYGQSSKYELQAMIIDDRGCGSFKDLSEKEVISLSIAEYIALRIFKGLKINSFNHVMLSKLFHDKRAPRFRPVEIFITREVDLAVSELSSHYVVDQHPWDSRNEIKEKWDSIRKEVLEEVKLVDPDFVSH